MVLDIVTYSFILVFLIDMLFKPRFDKTPEGDVFMWYTNLKSKDRKFITLRRK